MSVPVDKLVLVLLGLFDLSFSNKYGNPVVAFTTLLFWSYCVVGF